MDEIKKQRKFFLVNLQKRVLSNRAKISVMIRLNFFQFY